MSIRLDDIDYFLAVAEQGQVHGAAAALGVSQPAVTKGLQRLERALGFALFKRGARGMTLTPVAEPFRLRVSTLRSGLGEAIKDATDLHLGAMGLLRVGVSPFFVDHPFIQACLQLHHQRPAARLRVMINLNDSLIAALRQGDLDLSLCGLPANIPDDLRPVPLMRDDLYIAAREGHPLLSRRRLRLQDLADAEWMLAARGAASRNNLEARLAEVGLPPPRVAVEVNTSAGQPSPLLLHSDLVSLVSESVLAGPTGIGLVALPFAGARFPRTVGTLVRRDAPLAPLAQRFLEILQAVARHRPS